MDTNRKKGFTLLEILIIIIIIGIITSMVSGSFFSSLKKGRDGRRKGDLEQIQRAVEMYYEDKKAYPTAAATPGFPFGSSLCQTGPCVSGEKIYMQRVPNDPLTKSSYLYSSNAGADYKMYACLENDQQILNYVITPPAGFSCATVCKDKNNNNITCIWGVSSPNTNP